MAQSSQPTDKPSKDFDDRAAEREFYRYYHQSQRPKAPSRQSSPAVKPSDTLPAPNASPDPQSPFPSDDKALTGFAQLGALRLNARRCLISFFDRRNCYILAEATRSLSLQTGQPEFEGDELYWGTTLFPKKQSICYYTVNLPDAAIRHPFDDSADIPALVVNDLSLDHRFKDYPYVAGAPHSRFYAGVPIRSPGGHCIGTYCVLDENPRDGLSPAELSFLREISVTVMRHLEMTRATDDHRRGGVMVRSLGSFAEGKSSLEDWWHDPWDAEAYAPTADAMPLPRQRRLTSTDTEPPNSSFQDPFHVKQEESIISGTPSVRSQPSVNPASASITPASEVSGGLTTVNAASTKEEIQPTSLSPDVKTTFARAANMIRGATEADGAVFFDGKVSTFGGMVDDETIADAEPSQDKSCAVLGVATEVITKEAQFCMFEGVLRHLLRTYPHGQIFNFDDDQAPPVRDPPGDTTTPTPLVETLSLISSSARRPESSRSQDDENLLKDAFPNARSLVLYPLWDSHRDRWYAGAIIWSSDPMRVFTSEQELSYLAAFSNSLMAEVARLDVKLADAAKGDFISSISHELRSPLHGILGSCELLKDTHIDNFQSSMAQTIETCGKTLLDTINHVLDFAKINNLTRNTSKRSKKRSQSTKHIISPAQSHTNDILTLVTDVDLGVLTEEVLETVFAGHNFQRTATQNLFEKVTMKADDPLAVIVDINKSDNYVFRTQPGAWRRVLMNLFGNALKYTPAGYIKIKLQVTPSTTLYDDTSELRITCTDSGIGMSEEYFNNRLFHSFAQENPLSQGTGLGLSIVKQIVESLEGEIEVRSEKGNGTKFTVCCPLKPSKLSPAVCATLPDKQLLAVTRRTTGLKVQFVGFDDAEEYFSPVKTLKNKNATLLSLKALDSLCTEWFGMKVQQFDAGNSSQPDLLVSTESGAKWLRTQSGQNGENAHTAPVIVICRGAASAQSTTAITVPGQILECIAQPVGPHKLARALTSCLDRYANRLLIKSKQSDSTWQNVERLSLKENTPPISPTAIEHRLELHRPAFTSTLSAPEVRSASPSPVKTIKVPERHLHCLAVDDNPINLRLLRTFIDKLHHNHTLATNGVEAVDEYKAAASERRIDVVLMDINMPEMDGLEATRQIRAHERDTGLSPVTIIALTGLASSEAQQEAHASGVNLFLIKPVRLAELEVVLKGVVTADDNKGSEFPSVRKDASAGLDGKKK
ncbi:hypothetical protein B0J11DRAFT_547659 [Dendryphion nanum]|uniref:histidine kinase n=1 Tax=Dendryphion nanum TaxID=256645 RepID=A0A9P9EEW1_9PLEO|nr:hypothetical protein B0J11DRAFT_547659 [Dendryphion nanum]